VNKLAQAYPQEVARILAKYPPEEKRSAVMPLLYLAQREQNFLTKGALEDIADLLEISSTDVASIVGFYSLYYDQEGGQYRIQVCTDLPCALRGAEQFLEQLCTNLGIRVGETTPDGKITIEKVMCLAGCDHAPMFQVQSGAGLSYHEDQTVEGATALIEGLRRGTSYPTEPARSPADLPVSDPGPEPINDFVDDRFADGHDDTAQAAG
jgi:NADH-quinone oxidoreductase subunit E